MFTTDKLGTLARVTDLIEQAEALWPEVANDEQYIALGDFLGDLRDAL